MQGTTGIRQIHCGRPDIPDEPLGFVGSLKRERGSWVVKCEIVTMEMDMDKDVEMS